MSDGVSMDLKGQLKKYFSTQKGIIAVYLFGSHAKGHATAQSDVDLAILFSETVNQRRQFDKSLKISCDLMKLLNRDRVDVVTLNIATPVIKNQVYKYGTLIFCKNPVLAVRFKARSITEYLEFLPVRRLCESAIKKKALGYGR